jgi:hypothetical protein
MFFETRTDNYDVILEILEKIGFTNYIVNYDEKFTLKFQFPVQKSDNILRSFLELIGFSYNYHEFVDKIKTYRAEIKKIIQENPSHTPTFLLRIPVRKDPNFLSLHNLYSAKKIIMSDTLQAIEISTFIKILNLFGKENIINETLVLIQTENSVKDKRIINPHDSDENIIKSLDGFSGPFSFDIKIDKTPKNPNSPVNPDVSANSNVSTNPDTPANPVKAKMRDFPTVANIQNFLDDKYKIKNHQIEVYDIIFHLLKKNISFDELNEVLLKYLYGDSVSGQKKITGDDIEEVFTSLTLKK